MVSVSGLRGVVGEGFTEDVAQNYARSFAELVEYGTVLVARDARPSGEEVTRALIATLVELGCDVINVDMVPTPTAVLNVREAHADGGIVVTASHNPIEYNGMKFVSGEGIFLDSAEINRLKSMVGRSTGGRKVRGKQTRETEAVKRHIDKIKTVPFVDSAALKERNFKVAIDCVNGSASLAYPVLLEGFGCICARLFCEPDGTFPRKPEPSANNLSALSEFVKAANADVGFAVDPDGDRVSIVTDDGKPLGEELTVALVSKFVLSKEKGPVVVNYSTTNAVSDVASEFGVELERAPVGEANVVARMKEVKAVLGGEGNGGVIFPRVNNTRDAAVAMALLLQYMLESGEGIGRLASAIPSYHIEKRKISIGEMDFEGIAKKIKKLRKDGKLDQNDGIRIDWHDSWLHVRPSGTEPVIRIIAEAKTKQKAKVIANEATRLIVES
ncbi:MAG: phosphoglucosamine mutase [bacterium]